MYIILIRTNHPYLRVKCNKTYLSGSVGKSEGGGGGGCKKKLDVKKVIVGMV
jgi:hypothetical protein